MALLEVDNLSIGYRTKQGYLKAVEGVSFSLEEGRSLGFVGESGCGKTTIGMSLMGLMPPNGSVGNGRILFEGKDLLKMTEAERRKTRWSQIAMIFQAAMNAMNPVQRVGDQIAEAIRVHHPETEKDAALHQVEELYDLVGIPRDRLRGYPHQYSGGMKQRAIIAMALACKPKLIIADEPTTALDVIVQDQILSEVKMLQKEFNIGVIFISHDISIVADMCQDIAVMYAGQVVECGPREAVFDSPVHPYTKALLSSFPTITGEKSDLIPIPGETPNLIHPPTGCRFGKRCSGASPTCSVVPNWVQVGPWHRALCCHC
ncbi:MAG: peptide ABC transporter ATP-binding protein [Desulfobacteraceae bacterium 4572_87]|nr:MAG: peptide ABC transporter ATP-binding protein [Desulfobacteraceae bacterium 4572_87]